MPNLNKIHQSESYCMSILQNLTIMGLWTRNLNIPSSYILTVYKVRNITNRARQHGPTEPDGAFVADQAGVVAYFLDFRLEVSI